MVLETVELMSCTNLMPIQNDQERIFTQLDKWLPFPFGLDLHGFSSEAMLGYVHYFSAFHIQTIIMSTVYRHFHQIQKSLY